MGSIHSYAGFSQNPQHFFFLLQGDAEADPAIRAKVAGNGDELMSDPSLFHQFLCPESKMDGRKKDDSLGHGQIPSLANWLTAPRARSISASSLK
jgi:hypothetical protein